MRHHRVKKLLIWIGLLAVLLAVVASRRNVHSAPAVRHVQTHREAVSIAGAGDEGPRRVWEGGKP
jgi:uncharacterized membrane protein